MLTVEDEDGQVWVPIRQVCEALGKKDPGAYPRKLRAQGFEVRLFRVPRANGCGGWDQACIKEGDLARWLPTLRGPGQDCQVYFLEAPSVGLVKIGVAQDLKKRLKDLSLSSPVSLRLLKSISGGPKHEAALHLMFDEHRSHGEWFHLAPIAHHIEALETFEVPEEQDYLGILPRAACLERRKVETILKSESCQRLLRAVQAKPMGISELADFLGLSQPTVSAQIQRLETLRFVQIVQQGRKKVIHALPRSAM